MPLKLLLSCVGASTSIFSFAAFWTQNGADIDGEAIADQFGRSVSLSADGSVVAIGADTNDGNGEASGHVRVYTYEKLLGEWTQLGDDIDGEFPNDSSGWSVALNADGSVVAVGAPNNDSNGDASGNTRVFEYVSMSGTWAQLGGSIDGEAAGDSSGRSVSLSANGRILAVGAPNNDGNGDGSGHVRVFRYETDSWEQIGSDIDGGAAGHRSGESVSISGDGSIVAIGAYGGGANLSGEVRIYTYEPSTDAWTQSGESIVGEGPGDFSGWSTALSADGKTVVIGAFGNDGAGDSSGHARVYRYDDSTGVWSQLGDDIDGEFAGDSSGRSISVSSEGSIVAIGAPNNDGNGDGSGHTRVYAFDELAGAWSQLGGDIDGEAAFDFSGSSVSLSTDGSIVAIGGFGNDGGGNTSGHVRVLEILYKAADVLEIRSDAKTLGQMDVTDNPSTFNLFNASEVSEIESAARILGREDVTINPSSFNLFTEFDLVSAANAARTIVNVSARAELDRGESVTPGFVVLGEQKKMLIRAVGPKLADLGVPTPLPNPTMTIYKSRFDGQPAYIVAEIDDWKDSTDIDSLNTAMASVGAFPLEPTAEFQGRPFLTDDTSSAAALVTLDVGVYTVIVSAADDGVGEVLVEVYEVAE